MATKTAPKSSVKEKAAPPANGKPASLDTPAYQRKGKSADVSQAAAVADAPATAASALGTNGMRMPTINDVKLMGRLTAEPEIKQVGQQQVANFTVASEKRYPDGQGQWQKQVTFVPVAAWGMIADRAKSFLHKGSPVYLEGHLRTSKWTTKDGQNRSMLRLEAFKVQSLARGQNRSHGQEVGD